MKTPDAFAAYHEDLIEADYDCVDRLVVRRTTGSLRGGPRDGSVQGGAYRRLEARLFGVPG
ncbi:MAG: hypothetical protein NT154_32370 [Verrucomicrobia bacterium]|nr:hypothetical protein [Verrucomicrobiota bacterium]